MKSLLKLKLWCDYLRQRSQFAALLALQKHDEGKLPEEIWSASFQNMIIGKMTYFQRNKGLEMLPTIADQDTLLVRKLPYPNAKLWQRRQASEQFQVGDVVVLKDPTDLSNLVVRRLAAVSGYEMVSTNKEDEPFVIEDGHCWVVADNKDLKPREVKDSRTFGPVSTTNIVGRVVYRFHNMDHNGFVVNSKVSMSSDMPIIFVELDSAEMLKHNEEEGKGSQT